MVNTAFILSWPPSTNSLWRAFKGRNILSRRARLWSESASIELLAQGAKPIKGQVQVEIEFSSPTKHLYDLDNRIKAVLDLLVHNSIIEADDCSVVKRIVARVGSGFTGAKVVIVPYSR